MSNNKKNKKQDPLYKEFTSKQIAAEQRRILQEGDIPTNDVILKRLRKKFPTPKK